jgi:hypothetical protein
MFNCPLAAVVLVIGFNVTSRIWYHDIDVLSPDLLSLSSSQENIYLLEMVHFFSI